MSPALEPFILVAVAVTSVGAYLVGVRWRGRTRAGLRAALVRLLECVGVFALFAAVDLALGAAMIFGLRMISGRFVSLYLLDDAVWLLFPLLQAIAWCLWREE